MQEDLIILLEWLNANGIDELFNDNIKDVGLMEALAEQQKNIKAPLQKNTIRDYADRLNSIENLIDFVKNNEVYNNFRKVSSNSVVFDGDLNADILIINDIPDDADDINGKIFSEEDGVLLKNIMKSINVDKYFLLNSFFWRLPGNRSPIKDELDMCKPIIEKIVFLLKPKLIILTGNYSAYTFLGNGKTILSVRGKLLEYTNCYLQNSIPLTGIYSPTFVIKNNTKKQDLWHGLSAVRNILNKL